MIVASETAEFGQAEIMVGIIPGGGGTQRLARVIGKQRAMELVLTGRRIGAEQAHRWGLVNQVTPKKEWLQKAMEIAEVVSQRPPVAVRLGKQSVLNAERLPLEEGMAEERSLFEQAMTTEDRVEGMTAFMEKRTPEFKGR
jgi:enoyl-CoA hydratase/carnithine racemase